MYQHVNALTSSGNTKRNCNYVYILSIFFDWNMKNLTKNLVLIYKAFILKLKNYRDSWNHV